MITKKERREKKTTERYPSFSHSPSPPLHFTYFHTLPYLTSATNPSPTFPRSLALMADPHQLPPGNTAFGRLSALNSQLHKGLVTILHELSGVTRTLPTISEENENLREALHNISSQLANLPPAQDQQPTQAIADLQPSIRDLSHRVSAPTPALPHAPAPTHRAPPTSPRCRPPSL